MNTNSTYSSVSAGGTIPNGNHLPNYVYQGTNGDLWAWADDNSNTNSTDKYLALKIKGVWNYMVCDNTMTGKITFSPTRGTLFNIVMQY